MLRREGKTGMSSIGAGCRSSRAEKKDRQRATEANAQPSTTVAMTCFSGRTWDQISTVPVDSVGPVAPTSAFDSTPS